MRTGDGPTRALSRGGVGGSKLRVPSRRPRHAFGVSRRLPVHGPKAALSLPRSLILLAPATLAGGPFIFRSWATEQSALGLALTVDAVVLSALTRSMHAQPALIDTCMSLRIDQLQEVRTAPAAHEGQPWQEGPRDALL
jgi:hypothetical protein